MTLQEQLLEDAVSYHDRGWCCIPIKFVDGQKKPTVKWKRHQTVRPTQADLRNWLKRKNVEGLALVAGPVSGPLATRDFDSIPSYERWRDEHPDLARCLPTVRTLRGFHIYANSDLAAVVTLPDGEYRGATLSVAPHSLRDGFSYEWVVGLPAGPLPFVEHRILIGGNVAENAECHGSAISAISATSHSPSSPLSAFSAISATCPPEFVVMSTQPLVVGERNNKLLSLARGLKFNADLAKAHPDTLRALVRQWYERALPVIGTKDFDITWADFLHAWEHARYALGMDVVDQAALRVDPEDLPEVAANYTGHNTRRLIGLCAQLAMLNGSRRFFLSSHVAAERLGIEPVAAWRLLKMLCHDRVLRVLERGNEHRANRYEFVAPLPGEGGGGDE